MLKADLIKYKKASGMSHIISGPSVSIDHSSVLRGISSSSNYNNNARRESVDSINSGPTRPATVRFAAEEAPSGGGNNNNSSSTNNNANSQAGKSKMRSTVGDMDVKVIQLKQLFTTVDPLEERVQAATKIAAVIRGNLARNKYALFRDARMGFKWGRTRAFVAVIHNMTMLVSHLDKRMQQMKMRRDTLLLKNVLAKWHAVVRQALPVRRAVYQQAEEKRLIKLFKLKLQVFLSFREGCIGHGSIKQARKERRLLIERKRNEIIEENFRITGLRLLAAEVSVSLE